MTEVTDKKAVTKPAAKKKSSRNLTPKQRAEAIELWRTGEATYEQLMARYGKSKSTFQKLFAKEGVKHGEAAKQVQAQVQAQVQRVIADDVSVVAKRIKDTKDEHYNLSTAIAKLTGRIIMKAAQGEGSLAAQKEELKALNLAMQNLKMAREERFAVNDYVPGEKGDDDDLPELEVRELTQDQIKEMAQARGDDEDFERGLAEIEASMPGASPEKDGDDGAA